MNITYKGNVIIIQYEPILVVGDDKNKYTAIPSDQFK
jgi:hypothetical protein